MRYAVTTHDAPTPQSLAAPGPVEAPSDQPILPAAPAMEPPPMERRTPNLTTVYRPQRKRSLGRRVAGLLVPAFVLAGVAALGWYAYTQYQEDDQPVTPVDVEPADRGGDTGG